MQQKILFNDCLTKHPDTKTYQVFSIWTNDQPVYVGYTSLNVKTAIQNLVKHGIDFHTNDDSYVLLEGEPLLSVEDAKTRKIVVKEEYSLIPERDTTIKEVK